MLTEINLENRYSFLELLYEEANEHLRENDKKRDQVLLVMVTLSGAIFGFYEKLKVIPEGYKIILILLISLLSIFIPFILIAYRKWHIIYHLGVKVLQQLMYLNNKEISYSILNKLLRKNIKEPTFGYFFKTTETMIYNLFLFINVANLYVLSCSFSNVPIVIVISVFVVYLILFNYIHFYLIKKLFTEILKKDGYKKIWLLDFIKNNVDIYENRYLKITVDNSDIVKVISKNNGCVIIPITPQNKVVLLEIFRPALNKKILELPRGFAEESEDLEEAAKREIKEEIGGECNNIIRIGSFYPDTGLYIAKIDIFLALNVYFNHGAKHFDEGIKEIKEFDLNEVYLELLKGNILDSYTIVSLVFAIKHILRDEKGSAWKNDTLLNYLKKSNEHLI